MYAYAFGQLLALAVYARARHAGEGFIDDYLAMLAAGGSRPPVELAAMVGCDLSDPDFWDDGLSLIDAQVDDAIAAAHAAGRL